VADFTGSIREIGDAKLERPLVLGHECTGVMEDGSRVALDPAIPALRLCRRGPNLCPHVIRRTWRAMDYGMARLAARSPHSLPDAFNGADGAF
jgi:hypothetical protein